MVKPSSNIMLIPVMILLIGGIPLPGAAVYINTSKLRGRAWQSLVSLAGPLFSIIVLSGLCALFINLPALQDSLPNDDIYELVRKGTCLLIWLHVYVIVLNLLPIPPLDGWVIIEPWLPPDAQKAMQRYSNYGFFALIVLLWWCDPFILFMQRLSSEVATLVGVNLRDVFSALNTLQDNSIPLVGVILLGWVLRSKYGPPEEKAATLLRSGKAEEAQPLYEDALSRNRKPETLLGYASCLLSQGKSSESLVVLDELLEKEPDNARALSMKAATLAECGRLDESLAVADQAIANGGEDQLYFSFLVKATVLNERENFQEALENIDKYLSYDADNVSALFIKGSALEGLKRYDEALNAYDKLARNRDGYLRACLASGILLCATGRQKEGFERFEKILPPKQSAREEEAAKLRTLLSESASVFERRGETEMAQNLSRAGQELV